MVSKMMILITAAFVVLYLAATHVVADDAAKAPAAAPAPIKVHKLDHPLTIDGDLTKPEWKAVEPMKVDYINSKKGLLSDTPRMTVRFLWDEQYLYIGYEFFAKNLKAEGTGVKEGPEGNQREGAKIWDAKKNVDIAEFFITFKDPNFFWEIHHNELNQFNDVFCVVPDPAWKVNQQANVPYGIVFCPHEFIEDDGEFKLATAVKLLPKADGKPSTVNDNSDTDTGYTGEIRLPWMGIGAPKSARSFIKTPDGKNVPGPWKLAGQEIDILSVYQDFDLPERYHHSAPTKPPGGWFHHTSAFWPQFILSEDAK